MKTVIGVFPERLSAEDAIEELESLGYKPQDMSIVMRDRKEDRTIAADTGTNVTESTVGGVATGAAVGGLAGLLIGIGAIAIPGIGGLLIGGPLAAALGLTGAAATTISGAATGALAGGLIGALMGLGLSEHEAKLYEDRVREGAILLTVPVRSTRVQEVVEIMEDTGADQIKAASAREEVEEIDEDFSQSNGYRSTDYTTPVYAHGAKGGKVRRSRRVREE